MTAEELQNEVQNLAPDGVKVIMSKNAAVVTFLADATGPAAEFATGLIGSIDPLVVAQALEFDVEVKKKAPAKK